MTPDTSANMPPITPESTMAAIAKLIRNDGAALVNSKLPDELLGDEWQLAVPSDNDNSFADRGPIGFTLPEISRGIPFSPEPLAASIQYLSSYSSMKTRGRNMLILSAPINADNLYNQNILHRFQEPFREIVISVELPQDGYTTRRSGPDTTTPARFKFFLPDEKALSMFTSLQKYPDAISLLLRELWPGTQKVKLNSQDMVNFQLSQNPSNQAEATEIFAHM